MNIPSVSHWYAHKDAVARHALVVAALALGVAVVSILYAASCSSRPVLVIAWDRAGDIRTDQGKPLAQAREFQEQQVTLVTTALLLRNPEGRDLQSFLPTAFTGRALADTHRMKAMEDADFKARALRQRPEIARVEGVSSSQGGLRFRVVGQLIRDGTLGGEPLREVIPFTLALTLEPNPDLIANSRQPYVVTAFVLRYEPATQ